MLPYASTPESETDHDSYVAASRLEVKAATVADHPVSQADESVPKAMG